MRIFRCILLSLLFTLILLCLTACGNQKKDSTTAETQQETLSPLEQQRSYAYELLDGDWIAVFSYDNVAGNPAASQYLYGFTITNMRYLYDRAWKRNVNQYSLPSETEQITRYNIAYTKDFVRSWFHENEARRRDQLKVIDLLHSQQGKSPETLLAMDPADIEFEELDKALFFRLIKACLNREQQNDHPNVSLRQFIQHSDFRAEKDYQDNYRFQICYYAQFGYIKECSIDVQYKTGEEYDAYQQLSDLVEQGKADAGQQEAFRQLESITQAIKSENSFIAQAEAYKDKTIGGIDFGRLYNFLKAYETDDIFMNSGIAELYGTGNLPVPWEDLSEEEFLAQFGEYPLKDEDRYTFSLPDSVQY